MAYAPRLSLEHSRTLRRISWALKQPMTATSEDILTFLATIIEKKSICDPCRDKTLCETCFFHRKENRDYKQQIPSLLKK